MISKASLIDMKSRRTLCRTTSISVLLSILLAGCGTTTPLDTFNLSAPQPGVSSPSRKNTQLLVPTPTALKALDSENIVVSSAPGSIEYLKGAQWGDRLTNIVQSRLVQAYENTGVFGGIGRPGDGLAINYQILTDLRMFGIQAYASPKLAVVELAVKLMNDKNGEVRATRVFRTAIPVSGATNAAYVKALDAAFERTASEIVSWTVTVL
ncbi:ABC-type transport auxiliary lipoprotein family protein [Brucella sp. MAB-22]|nr:MULTISPECIES: ABC-type transport auxiliary lipoprotein family protein [Brucella]KAB2751588.1 ABC transporter [Brucella anthropi]MDH0366534.1 ABC-type transport auxiliary lipoprotein family protein [Brucella anthropi]RRY21900.1 ABC transporter [Brucella anthropi]UYT57936.1 ABC-type transport auxiliary lipoprotein family protein [Brucella sp. MAB-22]